MADFTANLRWREWKGRVEGVISAAPAPVPREKLQLVVVQDCNLDLLIEDIREGLRDRPYELVVEGNGWQFRSRPRFADAIRTAASVTDNAVGLSQRDIAILAAVAYTGLMPSEMKWLTRGTFSFLSAAVAKTAASHSACIPLIRSNND
ncbi:SMC-Scp complex subunit ScpB [Roseibium sp.]|uniref:SMC-Scp complex subunit ScpB n=1 Tax=Roseibium sp. TaxID=1936156 RepID=UPI00261C1FC6|nr:SMC-Scp complex subunit ScpB [Roseibium sp.]